MDIRSNVLANKFTIKKYDGDDVYSYAVFNSKDVKGMGTIIFHGQARPIVCGLCRYSARNERDRLEKIHAE